MIGIWGYGKTGKALASFFLRHSKQSIAILIPKIIPQDLIVQDKRIRFYIEEELQMWIDSVEEIFVSPGVDIKIYYQTIKSKLKTEIDLFFTLWKGKTIAITGSVGKTSITTFLGKILKKNCISNILGGNIGRPMTELLTYNNTEICAILEFSSFQLEFSKKCVPDLAIITNIFPNHLDRHLTFKAYCKSKYNILLNQKEHQKALIPLLLYNERILKKAKSTITYFCTYPDIIAKNFIQEISHRNDVFFIENNMVYKMAQGEKIKICDLPVIKKTFDENLLILAASCAILQYNTKRLAAHFEKLSPPEHRLEYINTYKNIDFYNDSKSTTITSTKAAINQFPSQKIILILGGLSKGVDRSELFVTMPATVQHIVCFGKEAKVLYQFCSNNNIKASQYYDLETAFEATIQIALSQSPCVVLFSPSGSSYDLFDNYQDRGICFKKLVFNLLL